MSRWHRFNPEKGNQVEPDSSAYSYMQADAMRKGETMYEQFIVCSQHPEEHGDARLRAYQASGLYYNPAAVPCPVCTLEANEKAANRATRLAEHAEEMVELLRESLPFVERGTAEAIRDLLSKIETPEEGK